MAGVLQETAARLLHAAGVAVTAVDIEPANEDVPELRSDTAAARIGLATATGARHVLVSAGYGLALAAAAGAPVRVADAVMDRLAVPVQGEDVLTPFLPPAAAQPPRHPGLRRRPEPRNMTFADGLDYWELARDFPGGGRPHWQDYSCTAADGSAVLASAAPEPPGFAVLVQTIDAEDYRGRTVTFRGQLRTTGVAGRAGLHLAVGRSPAVPGRGGSFGPVRDRVGDRHCRGRSRTDGCELLVIARLPGGDRGQAPHVEKAPQLLVTGGVVCSVHRPVVLAEKLPALSFGKASQDHQRVGGIFRRLCRHATQITPACRP